MGLLEKALRKVLQLKKNITIVRKNIPIIYSPKIVVMCYIVMYPKYPIRFTPYLNTSIWLRHLRQWQERIMSEPYGEDSSSVVQTHFFCSPEEIVASFDARNHHFYGLSRSPSFWTTRLKMVFLPCPVEAGKIQYIHLTVRYIKIS